jgi:hypothetical protein
MSSIFSLKRRVMWPACLAMVSVAWFAARSAPASRAPVNPAATRDPLKAERKPGEIVVQLRPGANVAQLAQAVGARVQRSYPARYGLHVLKIDADGDIANRIARLQQLPGVVGAEPNLIIHSYGVPPITPNDPFLDRQWGLRRSHVAEAHGVIIGQRDIRGPRPTIIAYIDSGISPTHPDLQNQLPGAQFTDPTLPLDDASDLTGHGTFGAGQAAAIVNNGQGIGSPSWEGVSLVPIRIFAGASTTLDIVLAGFAFATAYDPPVDVVNCSFGSVAPSALEHAAVAALANKGALVVCSSGNGRDPVTGVSPGVGFPAAFPECLAVGSIGVDGVLSIYSDGGPQLGLVAAGGDDDSPQRVPPGPPQPERLVFSTTFTTTNGPTGGDGYGFYEQNAVPFPGGQGTSFSAPLVSGGAAALIADHVVDCLPATIDRVNYLKRLLETTATNPRGVFTNEYGFGELNLEAAIKAGSEWIDIGGPSPMTSTPNMAELFTFQLRTASMPAIPVGSAAPLTSGRAWRDTDPDGGGGTEITGDLTVDPVTGFLDYQPNFPPDPRPFWGVPGPGGAGANRLNVQLTADYICGPRVRTLLGPQVTDPVTGSVVPARDYVFQVVPKVLQAGLQMVSFPYQLLPGSDPTDPKDTINFLFGGNPTTFARWVTSANRYAVFNSVGPPQDAEANLTTNSMGVPDKPIGVGFWSRVTTSGPLIIAGVAEKFDSYPIDLEPGFTLVGNPFTTPVPWTSVIVQFQGRSMSVVQAAQRGLIDQTIWSWDGSRYIAQVPPDGVFGPFDARWVRALAPVRLIMTRGASALRASADGTRLVAAEAPGHAAAWSSARVRAQKRLAARPGRWQGIHSASSRGGRALPPAAPPAG